jgi:hypothetical protein
MGMKQFQIRVLGTPILASWSWDSVGDDIAFAQVAAPPAFPTAPTITGEAKVGATLTLNPGVVVGGTVRTVELLRDDEDAFGDVIDDEAGETFIPSAGDIGASLRIRVTAEGPGGTVTATSAAFGPITDVPLFKMAGTGLRLATSSVTVAEEGNRYAVADIAIGMPDIDVTEIALFFPTFYCTVNNEVQCPAGYTIEGIATRAGNGGLRTPGTIDGGTDPVVIDPANPATAYGKWIIFRPAAPIPAGTTQIFTVSYFMNAGEQPFSRNPVSFVGLTSFIDGGTFLGERYQVQATSTVPLLSTNTNFTNAGGPRPPYPSMGMMRGEAEEIEDSAVGIGDSIQYGSAQSTSFRYFTSRMAHGQIEMALDDNGSSRRIAANIMAIPGWSMFQHSNPTSSLRQMWALEKARELNGGRRIADMVWCGHGRNSATEPVLSVLTALARGLASMWRGAIGVENAPLYWVGMVAEPTSTDIFQTVENQSPSGAQAVFPTGTRWTFNAAHESPTGELRLDGTVTDSVPLWPVSSVSAEVRDRFKVRPFTSVLTSPYSGTGPMFMADAPPVGAWIGFDADGSLELGNIVQAVTGSGPYEVSISIPGSPSIPSGAIVQERWNDGGVHPSPLAHTLYRDAIIAKKVEFGFTVPPAAPTVSGVTITGIPQDGQTLTAGATITGSPAPTVSYEWEDGAGATIGTGNTLLQNAATMGLIAGETITLRVGATNASGSDEGTATITFEVPPAQTLVQGATAGYFVDPANVPSGTSRITFRGKIKLPSLPATAGVAPRLFTQESTGCDLWVGTTGGLFATVEDSGGVARLNGFVLAGAGTIDAGVEHDIIFDVDQAANEVRLTVDGVLTTTAFTTSGSGTFQSNREVSFLATTAGATPVPSGTEFRDLSVEFNGTLRKAIPNNAALANADAWHRGGDFTAL